MNSLVDAGLNIDALKTAYRNGESSVLEVIEQCLRRISLLDRQGPCLNAMIAVNDTSRARAQELDKRRTALPALAPLHGVPLVIKDNINVAGLATTGGCAALRQLFPAENATVVDRLEAAGAVVLGKSSMSEFAWGTYDTENSMINGFTRNPHHLDYAVGGSSGGTAAAIAAGYCAAGLGTDTGCSVRAPASINNLVGLRPTHGLIDMQGVMPMNADWDTVGPMALNVRDLATVMDVMLGNTDQASTTMGSCERAACAPRAGESRVGVLRQLANPSNCDAAIIRLLDAAVVDLEASSLSVIEPGELEVLSLPIDIDDWYLRFRFDLDQFLDSMGGHSAHFSLQSILDSGKVLERYLQPLKDSLIWPHQPDEHPRREQMLATRERYREAFLELMQRHALDALAFPTFRYPPVLNGSLQGERPGADAPVGSNNYFASLTGFPAISVPMGFVEPGLPIGLQLLGRPYSETRLIEIAGMYERRGRRAPG